MRNAWKENNYETHPHYLSASALISTSGGANHGSAGRQSVSGFTLISHITFYNPNGTVGVLDEAFYAGSSGYFRSVTTGASGFTSEHYCTSRYRLYISTIYF